MIKEVESEYFVLEDSFPPLDRANKTYVKSIHPEKALDFELRFQFHPHLGIELIGVARVETVTGSKFLIFYISNLSLLKFLRLLGDGW